jgi:hypothetical protein
MQTKKFPPENRNDKDYFDTPMTENLLNLQEEKIQRMGSVPQQKNLNFIQDIDGYNDQKDPICFDGVI